MMNKIIESFLETHMNEYEIIELSRTEAFEHFINRLIINKYSLERFNPDDIMTGKGEIGLDGIGIIVNNMIVTDDDTLQEALKLDPNITVRFVFIQAKTSDRFDGDEIGTFCYGVRMFFESSEKRPVTNNKIENLIKIKDTIYKKSINFYEPPSLEMYYVCCGKWNEGNNLSSRIQSEEDLFLRTQNFGQVKLRPYDSENIITAYKELKKKVSKKFNMERKFSFPSMNGIKQAYSGLIKAKDYVNILKDNDGRMLTNIFEDNVRAFQGYNAVNQEIQGTIKNLKEQETFAVLNNGITIISRKIEPIGDQIEIFDYQIVNGCQTSYVLFDNQDNLHDNVYVLAKIIEVQDDEVLNRIIYTTNRQTEVKSEAFESSKPFHKGLEDYFNAIELEHRLYYERRSKQYDLSDTINKNRVVNLPSLTHAYIAVFLDEPHSTHRYYGELLRAYKNKIYNKDALYEPYYISAYFSFVISSHLKSVNLYTKYSKLRYHIACVMKNLVIGPTANLSKSKELKKHSILLIKYINDNEKLIELIETAISCIEEAIKETMSSDIHMLHRSKDFTQTVLEKTYKLNKSKGENLFLQYSNIVQCVIKGIDKNFVRVELKTEDSRKKGQIHISEVKNEYVSDLTKEFKIGDIVEVQIIKEEYHEKYGWSLSSKVNSLVN